jgi:hypothetical protein
LLFCNKVAKTSLFSVGWGLDFVRLSGQSEQSQSAAPLGLEMIGAARADLCISIASFFPLQILMVCAAGCRWRA